MNTNNVSRSEQSRHRVRQNEVKASLVMGCLLVGVCGGLYLFGKRWGAGMQPINYSLMFKTNEFWKEMVFPVIRPYSKGEGHFWTIKAIEGKNSEVNWSFARNSVQERIKRAVEDHSDLPLSSQKSIVDEVLLDMNLEVVSANPTNPSLTVNLPERSLIPWRTRENNSLFVRHGSTDMTPAQFINHGQLDLPMNKRGIQEIVQAITSLRKSSPSLIVTSPLKRTVQTAQMLSIYFEEAPYVIHDGLRPRDFGKWTHDKRSLAHEVWVGCIMKERFNQEVQEALAKAFPDSVETSDNFRNRVCSAIADIQQLNYTSPLIVSHGSILTAYLDSKGKCRPPHTRRYGFIYDFVYDLTHSDTNGDQDEVQDDGGS